MKSRLIDVENLMLNHWTDAMIQRHLSEKYGCSKRSIKDYISQVRTRWQAEAEENRPTAKAAAINRTMRLARELRNNPAEVLKVEKFLAELEGTKAPLQVEQETSLELDSRASEALSTFAQALGVPLEKLED